MRIKSLLFDKKIVLKSLSYLPFSKITFTAKNYKIYEYV